VVLEGLVIIPWFENFGKIVVICVARKIIKRGGDDGD
jgi:hypothetical protein